MQRDIRTSARGRDYEIRLHLPQAAAPEAGFAAIWLLDANTDWAAMQQALREDGAADVAIVGVGWPVEGKDQDLRRRDFTLPARHAPPAPHGGGEWHVDGDCDAFLAFLVDELRPALLRAHPLDPARQVLLGHSLGGLFALHTLMRRPRAFAGVVAASPSIWWDQAAILDAAEAHDWSRAQATRLALLVGAEEQTAGPEKPPEIEGEARAATLGMRHMVDNAAALAALLQARGIAPGFGVLEGETHASVVVPAAQAALAMARALPVDGI
ncbi:alpha/beta hydrolase [Coralloluteibacterium stylophorae]|uniref:Alpha/beta hydrolase n=1 Tax=Coralloluteibacterium stylophorae TaxID=1776034 RepID=A0A8J7VSH2_9GAMM|nr:alpha/beta hydrolase-fold protein [Coralloluteibacterium stylophorae]MBS7455549.1 alpha/beta hydrolase [Coralloluteibacterium stylophorae]